MKLADYYIPEPIKDVVGVLSDKRLSHEQHRSDVNMLVMNLVIKYIAEYLGCAEAGIGEIQEKVEEAAEATNAILSPRRVMQTMMGEAIGQPTDIEVATTDAFGIQCITDTQQTAAIVKEIIFNDKFQTPTGDFVGVDIGSGTGILTLACVIAGRRSAARRSSCMGLEKQSIAVARSTATLERILGPDEFGIRQLDVIRARGLMHVFAGLPMSFWISETISSMTPKIRIRDNEAELAGKGMDSTFATMSGAAFDPFPIVIRNTTLERPQFVGDVRAGKTAMFPDLINGDFQPDLDRTKMRLRTAPGKKHVPLHKIGREFTGFEEIFPGASTSSGKMRFAPNDKSFGRPIM